VTRERAHDCRLPVGSRVVAKPLLGGCITSTDWNSLHEIANGIGRRLFCGSHPTLTAELDDVRHRLNGSLPMMAINVVQGNGEIFIVDTCCQEV
jgi:hypothetical protein